MQQRLQKLIAAAGIASRRHAEELITSGRVTVNGKVVDALGAKADPETDHIKVNRRLINSLLQPREKVYILLNKPKGYLSSLSDPKGRLRFNPGERHSFISQRHRCRCPIHCREGVRACRLGKYPAIDGESGSPASMEPRWFSMYRRRGACHVAYWWSRNQRGHSGCGGCGQHSLDATEGR